MSDREEIVVAAAVKLQSVQRGRVARAAYAETRRRYTAAVQLQRFERGRRARQLRRGHNRVVQAFVAVQLAYRLKRRVRERRRRHTAASSLQRAWREHRRRVIQEAMVPAAADAQHAEHRASSSAASSIEEAASRPADASSGPDQSRFALGSRLTHSVRGAGIVTEHMPDGRIRVKFDDGEEHRYKEKSLHKLTPLAAVPSEFRFELGSRLTHSVRGPGTVTELMTDGRIRVAFDDGEEHRYKEKSLRKLTPLAAAEPSSSAPGAAPGAATVAVRPSSSSAVAPNGRTREREASLDDGWLASLNSEQSSWLLHVLWRQCDEARTMMEELRTGSASILMRGLDGPAALAPPGWTLGLNGLNGRSSEAAGGTAVGGGSGVHGGYGSSEAARRRRRLVNLDLGGLEAGDAHAPLLEVWGPLPDKGPALLPKLDVGCFLLCLALHSAFVVALVVEVWLARADDGTRLHCVAPNATAETAAARDGWGYAGGDGTGGTGGTGGDGDDGGGGGGGDGGGGGVSEDGRWAWGACTLLQQALFVAAALACLRRRSALQVLSAGKSSSSWRGRPPSRCSCPSLLVLMPLPLPQVGVVLAWQATYAWLPRLLASQLRAGHGLLPAQAWCAHGLLVGAAAQPDASALASLQRSSAGSLVGGVLLLGMAAATVATARRHRRTALKLSFQVARRGYGGHGGLDGLGSATGRASSPGSSNAGGGGGLNGSSYPSSSSTNGLPPGRPESDAQRQQLQLAAALLFVDAATALFLAPLVAVAPLAWPKLNGGELPPSHVLGARAGLPATLLLLLLPPLLYYPSLALCVLRLRPHRHRRGGHGPAGGRAPPSLRARRRRRDVRPLLLLPLLWGAARVALYWLLPRTYAASLALALHLASALAICRLAHRASRGLLAWRELGTTLMVGQFYQAPPRGQTGRRGSATAGHPGPPQTAFEGSRLPPPRSTFSPRLPPRGQSSVLAVPRLVTTTGSSDCM